MALEASATDLLKRRDVANFIKLRNAHPGDDTVIGGLLIRSFRETYAIKLPYIYTSQERESELRDVHSRRSAGCVRVLELGYELIGTYSLIPPENAGPASWRPFAASLRCLAIDPKFHSLRLSDALLVDAIGMAHTWKVDNICLHVQMGANGVARLYERHGFERDPEGDTVVHGYNIQGYVLSLQRRSP